MEDSLAAPDTRNGFAGQQIRYDSNAIISMQLRPNLRLPAAPGRFHMMSQAGIPRGAMRQFCSGKQKARACPRAFVIRSDRASRNRGPDQ
jgi:hypothetical protein